MLFTKARDVWLTVPPHSTVNISRPHNFLSDETIVTCKVVCGLEIGRVTMVFGTKDSSIKIGLQLIKRAGEEDAPIKVLCCVGHTGSYGLWRGPLAGCHSKVP